MLEFVLVTTITSNRDSSNRYTDFNGEFDPGSELTLAACITHASRAGLFAITSRVA